MLTAQRKLRQVYPLVSQTIRLSGSSQYRKNLSDEEYTNLKEKISEQTKQGFELAKEVTANLKDFDERKFNLFIDKISEIEKTDSKLRKMQKESELETSLQALKGFTPFYDAVGTYRAIFDDRVLSHTFDNVAKIVRGVGSSYIPGHDYTHQGLEQGWQLANQIDEFKFGMKKGYHFTPHNIALTLESFVRMEYKDTEILPLITEKLQRIHAKTDQIPMPIGQKGAKSTRQFYNETNKAVLDNNEEFVNCLEKLMNWRTDANRDEVLEQIIQDEPVEKDEMKSVVQSMYRISQINNEQLEMQSDLANAIEQIRYQYLKIASKIEEEEFLFENFYIARDVLKLEEILVEAGLLRPEEAKKKFDLIDDPMDKRIDRATGIFYDIVQDYYPELVSPDYGKIKSTTQNIDKHDFISIDKVEDHNTLDLMDLGRILRAIDESKHIARRDTLDDDFYNDYFRSRAYPEEQLLKADRRFDNMVRTDSMVMRPKYGKYWASCNENYAKIMTIFKNILATEETSLNDLLYGLGGVSHYDYGQQDIQEEIVNKISEFKSEDFEALSIPAKIAGIYSLGYSQADFETRKILGELIISDLKLDLTRITLDQKLDILWGLSSLNLFKEDITGELIKEIDSFGFDNIGNQLSFRQFNKLGEIFQAVRASDSPVKFENMILKSHVENVEQTRKQFEEENSRMDPFKEKILLGIAEAVSKVGVEFEEKTWVKKRETEIELMRSNLIAHPDIVFGYKGKKVAIFLNNADHIESNKVGLPKNGREAFQFRAMEAAIPNFKCVSLPIESIIDYDLTNLKTKMRPFKGNSITDILDRVISEGHSLDISNFFKFTSDLMEFFTSGKLVETDFEKMKAEDVEGFLVKLGNVIYLKNRAEASYHRSSREASLNELKAQLMKVNMHFDALPDSVQTKINQFTNEFKSVYDLLQELKNQCDLALENNEKVVKSSKIENYWFGTRIGVEVPNKNPQTPKTLGPELLNRGWLQNDDYFQYEDWKTTMMDTYNSHHLNIRSERDTDYKYFYQNKGRRQSSGIFPSGAAQLSEMHPSKTEDRVAEAKKLLGKYAGAQMGGINKRAMLLQEELMERSERTNETRMMTNLLNIRNSLKKSQSDDEILDFLTSFDFTDQLISQHLNLVKIDYQDAKKQEFVPRDSSAFREKSKQKQMIRDPFTDFYLEEHRMTDVSHIERETKNLIKQAEDSNNWDLIPEIKEKSQERIENVYLNNAFANEDQLNITDHQREILKIHTDIDSLIQNPQYSFIDQEAHNSDMSNSEFLHYKKRQAETTLIKTKIMNKLHKKEELSELENQYLEQWRQDINNSNMLNVNKSMMPTRHSTLKVKDLSSEDLKKLNSVELVDFEGLENFSLNDLCVEMGSMIDIDTLNRLQFEIYSENQKSDWSLPDDYELTRERNKEIDLLLGELEENAFRKAGAFDDDDLKGLESMVAFNMQKDRLEERVFDMDQRSLNSFLDDVNNKDDRFELFDQWFTRKEDEHQKRFKAPEKHQRWSDKEMFNMMDSQFENERTKLWSSIFGDKQVTQKSISSFINELCMKFQLFSSTERDFPEFMPHLIILLMRNPHTSVIDKEKLETYCDMYELNWKGNAEKTLAMSPVDMSESRVIDMDFDHKNIIKRAMDANTNFMSNLKSSFMGKQ